MCSLCTVPQLPSLKSIGMCGHAHTHTMAPFQWHKWHKYRANGENTSEQSWDPEAELRPWQDHATWMQQDSYSQTRLLHHNVLRKQFLKERTLLLISDKKKDHLEKRHGIVHVRREDMATSFRAAEWGKSEIDLTVFVPPQQRAEQPSANCSKIEHINLLMTQQQHGQIENTEEEEEGSL